MKIRTWEIYLAVALIVASVLLYIAHYLIFLDIHHIAIYTLGDIAFLPIEVLLVTLVIHRLLERRDLRRKLEKLNMVIGVYFSAVGTHLLALLSDHDPGIESIRGRLQVQGTWTAAEFDRVRKLLSEHPMRVRVEDLDLVALRSFLGRREDLLIRMLENPILLEHESFTDLLRATFHLAEELQQRKDLERCSGADRTHVCVDIERIYGHLIREWLNYMEYLKTNYPYLFSLAMRTNPFDVQATVEIP